MASVGRKWVWGAAAGLVVAVVAAWTLKPAGGSREAAPVGPRVVRWAIGLPTSWDPVTSKIGWDVFGLNLAYEGLTEINAKGLPEPGLAESWAYNAEGTEVRFKLRPHLRFSDGTPLDAQAVVDYFVRSKTQKDARSADLLKTIVEIVPVDALTVLFKLSQADYQVPLLFSGRVGHIASPTAAAQDQKRLELYPVGAGPFRVVESIADEKTVLEKNPDYWRASEIHIDRIEIYPKPDPASAVSAVQTGVFNVAFVQPAQAKAAEAAGLPVEYTSTGQVALVSINQHRAPFTNPLVVQALRYAFDREEFVKLLNFGVGSATNQPFPSRYPQFDESIAGIWPYDPEKARALLAQAGYKPGDLSIEFTQFGGDTGPFAELVQEQLKKVGITVTIRVIPAGKATQMKNYDKDFVFTSDTSTGRESPVQALSVYYGPQGIMNGSAPDAAPAFLEALNRLRTTPLDAPDYQEKLKLAVRTGVQQNPSDYLYEIPWTFIKGDGVTRLAGGQGQIRWEGVRVGGPQP